MKMMRFWISFRLFFVCVVWCILDASVQFVVVVLISYLTHKFGVHWHRLFLMSNIDFDFHVVPFVWPCNFKVITLGRRLPVLSDIRSEFSCNACKGLVCVIFS
jgi:hypothetical protein